ncbi:Transposon Tf2-6 polyprotein [Labeo rohita]|uniref:ribonuclease H n=1 Tax=Labeo rohita TaxID=84645 RepID=A0ABQ8L7E5_LABRO|nr:Transposon Tf2-6 polyprotein [Labeo rohita]
MRILRSREEGCSDSVLEGQLDTPEPANQALTRHTRNPLAGAVLPPVSVSCVLQVNPPDLTGVPADYYNLCSVFSKSQTTSLPPHHPYDCTIDLLPGTSPPRGRLYSLSGPEREPMDKRLLPVPCIDYRGLNDITVQNRYPLPSAFEMLQGARVFTKLDLRNAYHLVRIREGDKWKTVFNNPSGHYEYLVLPFGLTNAPAVFQGLVNNILENQLFVKAEKCEFHTKSVTFLGHKISSKGIKLDPAKIEAVTKWLVPDSRKALQRFLGPAERNYDIGNRELLVVRLASGTWRHWLEGSVQPFLVWMDHKNLEYICSAKRLSSHQARWALFFGRFNFTLSYRPGSKNVKPNALSHLFGAPEGEILAEAILPEAVVVGALSWGIEGCKCQRSAQWAGCLCRLRCALKSFSGVICPSWCAIQGFGGNLLAIRQRFLVAYIGHGCQTVRVDSSMYDQGREGMGRGWSRPAGGNSLAYTERKPPKTLPIGQQISPESLDGTPAWTYDPTEGLQGISGLPPWKVNNVVDRFSKAVHFIPLLKLPSAWETAQLMVDHVFHLHGLPVDVVSDRGPQFASQFWK